MPTNYTFKRVEKKYLLSKEEYEYVLDKIGPFMHIDKYGETEISNIYFDNSSDELIETSLSKPTYKEKLRLRSYCTPDLDSTVFFEMKKKFKGTVYKRRIKLPLYDAYRYIETGEMPKNLSGNIPYEIDYMMKKYSLFPKVFVGCKRKAFVSFDDSNLRITFDCDIVSRYENIELENGYFGNRIIPKNTYLMEIKIQNAMPLWLAHILSEKQIFPQSFSKVGKAHLQHKYRKDEQYV